MSSSASCAGVAAAAVEMRSVWELWRRWDLILSPWWLSVLESGLHLL